MEEEKTGTNDSFSLLPFQRQLNVKGYQCSLDLRYVLFKHNVKQVSIHYELFDNLHLPVSLPAVIVIDSS